MRISVLPAWSKPWLFLCGLATIPLSGGVGTGSLNLAATINPAGSISAPSSATLVAGDVAFQPFIGSLTLTYWARTTPAGGGTVTLSVSSDFTPAGGPSVAAGGLTYTCAGATLGTPCSGTETASTAAQTPVLALPAAACTGGGAPCSPQSPNSVNLTFIVVDDSRYATGSYSAKVTFTISAT